MSESALHLAQLRAGVDFARGEPGAAAMANYVYAIIDRASHEALLVDPAWAPAELVDLLEAADVRLVGAVLTHYHADHAGGLLDATFAIAGVGALLERSEVPLHVQRSELEWLERSTGLPRDAFTPHEDGELVHLGRAAVRLLHTPGHTPGSQCVLVDGRALTGDTLFLDGCGRTDLPGGDALQLHETLQHRLGSLPDTVEVYPGHAYSPAPFATLGSLRATNPVLAPLSEAQWLARFG